MDNNYHKAYVEVLEILKYVPDESVNKIPKEMLDMFELKKDKNYKYSRDYSKTWEEQKRLDETSAIHSNICRDYWATPTQREKILRYEQNELNKLEQEKKAKYDPDFLFKSKQKKTETIKNNEESYNDNLPIEIKKEHFFNKLINFFKKFFSFLK